MASVATVQSEYAPTHVFSAFYGLNRYQICKTIHKEETIFKISAGPRTPTGKIWECPASFPPLSYILALGQVIFTIHLPYGQVHSIWNFKAWGPLRNFQKIFLQWATCVIRIYFFTPRVAGICNCIPHNVVGAQTVNSFKNRLHKLWAS